jgi:phosphatidylinositol alpha-mannosyltransferase
MSLRVGIVTEYYYPLLGGITENVHNTATKLRARGHTVKIITSNLTAGTFAVQKRGDRDDPNIYRLGRSFPIYKNGSLGHFTMGRNLLIPPLHRILEIEKFDVLHVHSPIIPTLPLMAVLLRQCPVVGTFHTYFDGSLIYSLLRRLIQREILDTMACQIAVSRSCVESIRRYFRMNMRIIPNGVETSQFSPAVAPLEKFDRSKKNLLFLSRFDPRNGLRLMIEAFAIVKASFPDVRLVVVGDGPLKAHYKGLVPKEHEADVYFEGARRDDRPRYFASCDVFCSPISKASFGVTLLEAMASGKPIVAVDNVGYRDLLGPAEGILVPPNSPEAYARAILGLLRDPDAAGSLGAAGREKALRFSWETVVSEIEDCYRDILGHA